jgi:hypothetical protein
MGMTCGPEQSVRVEILDFIFQLHETAPGFVLDGIRKFGVQTTGI